MNYTYVSPEQMAAMPFEDAAVVWFEGHKREIAERTAFDYERWIRMLDRVYHGVPLNQIGIGEIETYRAARAAGEIGGEKKHKAGPVCINHEVCVLAMILQRARLLETHPRVLQASAHSQVHPWTGA